MEFFKNFYKEDKIVGLCAFKKKDYYVFKFSNNDRSESSKFFGDLKVTPNMFR